MKVTFFGGTQGVTGSNYLVETGRTKFLIDCGLFQGPDEEKKLNWEKFGFDPSEIDFLIATHSHIDHIGRVPYLVNEGFSGKIYSTEPTRDFAGIFLEDCAGHMGNEAEDLNLPPLFEVSDVAKVMPLFDCQTYHQKFSPAEGVEVEFLDAGHILGAAIVRITAENKTIIFSGDLGNPPVPILRDTEFPEKADVVVMESTYGNRLHKPSNERVGDLEQAIEQTIKNGGTLLMPAFAMERTQEILYELNELLIKKEIASTPVYLDSPLAIKATEVYKKYPNYFDQEAKLLIKNHIDFFGFKELKYLETPEQSMALDRDQSPKIIIAGSGMSNGGRIVHHEKVFLPDPKTTLLIVGYQVNGTLGRRLIEGEKEVKIDGRQISVAASIKSIDSYSAHADQTKLIDWQAKIDNKKVVLVHGEQEAKEALSDKIIESGKEVIIAKFAEVVEI